MSRHTFPVRRPLIVLLMAALTYRPARGFSVAVDNHNLKQGPIQRRATTARPTLHLHMAKGFQGAKNKQAALAQKLALAKQKQQRLDDDDADDDDSSDGDVASESQASFVDPTKKTDEKDAERVEFERLLAENLPRGDTTKREQPDPQFVLPVKKKPESSKGSSSGGPKVKARDLKRARKRNRKASGSGGSGDDVDDQMEQPLHQGDQARRHDFETLIPIDAPQNPLGPIRAAKLVPWVPPYLTNHLVIVADPRRQSSDLRATVQYLADTCYNIVAIAADDPSEVMAWRKRVGINENDSGGGGSDKAGSITFLVDSSTEWMRRYSCIDDTDRWSTHILVIDSDGIIRSHCAKVDPSQAKQIVTSMIDNINNEGI